MRKKVRISKQDIMDKGPCVSIDQWFPDGWTGTLTDVLRMDQIPFEYRLWLVGHDEYMEEREKIHYLKWKLKEEQRGKPPTEKDQEKFLIKMMKHKDK